ncbi:unnamed protein product [Trifolium pratense]|uniref:Uncharacterized protein n=1 Tax=Trifolium pratense TaxID=57577 RepID=A0ACB0LX36_TRIPR|nr:unnamed protein product [Trifolium pratense]
MRCLVKGIYLYLKMKMNLMKIQYPIQKERKLRWLGIISTDLLMIKDYQRENAKIVAKFTWLKKMAEHKI